MSETGEMLKSARDIIASGAWIKGSFDEKGEDGVLRHCAIGALAQAEIVHRASMMPALGLLQVLVPVEIRDINLAGNPVIRFNDHPATTREDVVSLFDKALAELGEL